MFLVLISFSVATPVPIIDARYRTVVRVVKTVGSFELIALISSCMLLICSLAIAMNIFNVIPITIIEAKIWDTKIAVEDKFSVIIYLRSVIMCCILWLGNGLSILHIFCRELGMNPMASR